MKWRWCLAAARAQSHRVSIAHTARWLESWRTFAAHSRKIPMNKKHISENLSAYIHGELSQDESLNIRTHLYDCPACRSALDETQFGAQLASTLSERKAPES